MAVSHKCEVKLCLHAIKKKKRNGNEIIDRSRQNFNKTLTDKVKKFIFRTKKENLFTAQLCAYNGKRYT